MTTPLSDKDLAAKIYSKNPGQFEFALSLHRLDDDWGACSGGQRDVRRAAVEAGMRKLEDNRALPLAELVEHLPLKRTEWMLDNLWEERQHRHGDLIGAILGDIFLALSVRFKERKVKGVARDATIIGQAYHEGKAASKAVAGVAKRQFARYRDAGLGTDEEKTSNLLYYPTNEDGTLTEILLTSTGRWWGEEEFKAFLAEVIRLRVRPQVKPKGKTVILDAEEAAA